MIRQLNMLKYRAFVVLFMALPSLTGCYTVTTRTELQEVGSVSDDEIVVTRQGSNSRQEAPGQATLIWEEPMVDVVDVPPGLDPEGHYYRPAHKSIMEIRQGRWQYYDRSKK